MNFPHLKSKSGVYLDQVQLTGMLLSCVIGIHSNERHRKQPVTIDLCLYLDTQLAAASESIVDTIDYSAAVKEISFILEQCEFQLIEGAVEVLCRYFLTAYSSRHGLPELQAIMVRISKPSALTHGIVPSVQILREKTSHSLETGTSQRLDYGKESTLILHSVNPGSTLTLAPSQTDRPLSVFPLGRFMSGDQSIKSRALASFPASQVSLQNNTNQSQLLLVHNGRQIS